MTDLILAQAAAPNFNNLKNLPVIYKAKGAKWNQFLENSFSDD
jgi:hypothetical protein